MPPHLYSHGSATIATIQQVAGAAGTAAFVALLAYGTAIGGRGLAESATPNELMAGVHLAFLGGAIVAPLAILASRCSIRRPKEPGGRLTQAVAADRRVVEGVAEDALAGAHAVEVRRDAAHLERPARAEDQAEVDVLGRGDDAVLQHPVDLVGQAVLDPRCAARPRLQRVRAGDAVLLDDRERPSGRSP